MNVLFLSPVPPWPPRSGGRIRTFELLKAVSGTARVHLCYVREPGVEDAAEAAVHDALLPHCASLKSFARTPPGTLDRLAHPKLARWFHSAPLAAWVKNELARGAADLVHVDEMFLHPVVPREDPTPLVIHHHKLDVEFALATGASSYDLSKLRRLERAACARTPHHVLCGAPDAERLAGRATGLRCHVVPNGVDPEHFRPTSTPRVAGRLLFLASLDYAPNVEALQWLLDGILPRVRATRPDAHLHVVGARPTPAVRSLVAAAGEGAELVGEVEDVRPHLAGASLMVVPLRQGGGSRLKIAEALAAGCPVVSTTVGAEGLELVDGEHLCLADGEAALAQASLRLLADPALAARYARAGRRRILERNTWSALGQRLQAAWRSAAEV